MSNLTGRTLGPYQVGRLLGEGGMSDVYEAVDTRTNQPVALKVLRLEHNQSEAKIKRFWVGAHSAMALKHPNIVPVYDADLADGHYYLTMQRMEGGSVADLLKKGPLPLAQVALLVAQIASALDYAHSRAVIHRDIKPSNILLSADHATAYLSDFGVARVTGQETVTSYGTLIGTPEYMSPEQIQGHKLDGRSDIYSLGVTAYHMLTGHLPFGGEPAAILYQHVRMQPQTVRTLNRAIPNAASKAVGKAMAKSPGDRQAQAALFAEELQAALTKRTVRWPLWAGAGTAAVLLALLFFRPPPPPVVTTTATATEQSAPEATDTRASATQTIGPTSTTAVANPTSTAAPTDVDATPAAPVLTPLPPTAVIETTVPQPTAVLTPTVSLITPPDGAVIPLDRPRQTFAWVLSRQLEADEAFEIRVRDETGSVTPLITFRESTVTDDFLNRLEPGAYRWQVVLIHTDPGDQSVTDISASNWFDIEWGR